VALAEDFTVMSYNILSPRYLKCANYQKLPKEVIDTGLRITRIANLIMDKDPDIVSLQEVEEETLKIISDTLGESYFITNSKPTERDKDFLAILYKKNKFSIEELRVVNYPTGAKNYLANKLKVLENNKVFWVINTKTKWDKEHLPVEEHLGFQQINYLSNEITTKYDSRVIVCGDLNVVPDSKYLKPLLQFLNDSYFKKDYPTVKINSSPRRIDYILHSKEISSAAYPVFKVDSSSNLPSIDHPSDHIPLFAKISL
jgi:mRNA deadenylase 3'-5' endonuclease subunit Ccr4